MLEEEAQLLHQDALAQRDALMVKAIDSQRQAAAPPPPPVASGGGAGGGREMVSRASSEGSVSSAEAGRSPPVFDHVPLCTLVCVLLVEGEGRVEPLVSLSLSLASLSPEL